MKGVFSPEKSIESLNISKFSRISRKWSESPFFSTVWQFSRNSRISKFSRISRKWTFLKRPLFQKTPFSEPEFYGDGGGSRTGNGQIGGALGLQFQHQHTPGA